MDASGEVGELTASPLDFVAQSGEIAGNIVAAGPDLAEAFRDALKARQRPCLQSLLQPPPLDIARADEALARRLDIGDASANLGLHRRIRDRQLGGRRD